MKIRLLKTQPEEDLRALVFQVINAHLLELFDDIAVARAIRLAGVFDLALFLHQGRDALVAFDDLFHHGLLRFEMRLLRQVTDVDIFLDLHGPGDGFHLPADNGK